MSSPSARLPAPAAPTHRARPQPEPARNPAGLAVDFVPFWPKNPYHAELARHLADHQVAVAPARNVKAIAASARRSRTRPDVLHLHALPRLSLRPAALGRWLAFWRRLRQLRRAGVKLVWTVHNIVDHESAWPRFDRAVCRLFYRRADAVIVHSLGARHAVERAWHAQRRHGVYIIPHASFIGCYPAGITRAAARALLGLPADATVFLFLGNIRPYKGVVPLVRTFQSIATPSTRLVIAGEPLDTGLREEITRAIDGSPLIAFHPGFLPDDRIQIYMAAADAVVFPYTRALTSGALLLAMSFGVACVAPLTGALADTLDAEGGFRYEPDDPQGLDRALQEAIRQPERLAAMGAHNHHRAAAWTWADAAAKTAAIYRTVCAEVA